MELYQCCHCLPASLRRLEQHLDNRNPYLLDCTWTANNEVAVDASGKEFTTNLIFFTELKRNGIDATMPKRDWYIARGDTTAQADPLKAGANVIKAVTEWDMSPFGEEPDYKILT